MTTTIFGNLHKKKKELILVACLLIISCLSHSYGMFRFPYYENDEGTYMSQAWSLVRQGRLAPYTYWYDHAPAGWMMIALWTKLSGGFFTFGPSINSGRALMLVVHLASTGLLYYIAKKLSGAWLAGTIAVLIFSLSPLGIYFQRRVLLDNMMIFWVLAALALLLRERLKLRHIMMSAIAFGIAVLTKENAVFFFPAFLYTIATKSHPLHKSFTFLKWIVLSGSVITLYLMYAVFKGELLPSALLGDNQPHVSLLTTLQQQGQRGRGLPFWDGGSDFYTTFVTWLGRDAITVITGGIATLLGIVMSIKIKSMRIPSFFVSMFWLFLLRGNLVIDFYITPLIPLLSLQAGMVAARLIEYVTRRLRRLFLPLSLLTPAAFSAILLIHPIGQYTHDETANQAHAINWAKENLTPDSHMVVDAYALVDFWEARFSGDASFPNADWFWKIQSDPEIRDGKYRNDWKQLDYIALTHEMLKQVKDGSQSLLTVALNRAYPLKEWKEGSTSYFDAKDNISTNGDWASLYRVRDSYTAMLDVSWQYYKEHFIHSYGQVISQADGNAHTTSEGQSYAMLRAVWQNDKTTFDGVWMWTRDHLQFRTQDKLFSWRWEKDPIDGVEKVTDPNTAADADCDIALALLFAYRQWGDEGYFEAAQGIIKDIWRQDVQEINGRRFLASSSESWREEGFLVNPSYISPAHFRIFAEADPTHPWMSLAEQSYDLLNEMGEDSGGQVSLPPNWLLVRHDGTRGSAVAYVAPDADHYGYDAFRIFWRIALDDAWFHAPQARKYLDTFMPFYKAEWERLRSFASWYDRDGRRLTAWGSISTDVGALSVAAITAPDISGALYTILFDQKFNFAQGYWGEASNYYDQNWAWFGTALYSGNLPNLYAR